MKQAPNFSLQDQNGNTKTLADYAGQWLVLYFYPKDDTPGCTVEACKFRDERDVIAQLGHAEVVGISLDSVESHKNFIEKYGLNFTLLSDPDHVAIEAYDSWQPGILKPGALGTKRNTFLIDPNGTIVKEYLGVNPASHAVEIIEDLQDLQRSKD